MVAGVVVVVVVVVVLAELVVSAVDE